MIANLLHHQARHFDVKLLDVITPIAPNQLGGMTIYIVAMV